MPDEQKSNDQSRLPTAICIFLVILVWLVFGQTIHFGFVNYDDDLYVYKNPVITHGLTLHGLKLAFTSIHPSGNWHPLTTISHMLDCQLFGVRPGPQHAVNLAIHIVNSILLLVILQQMTRSSA